MMFWRRKRPLIFISYRRKDTPDWAGRLFDTLNSKERFRGNVYRDINDRSVGNFVRNIQGKIGQSYVLIALIGNYWLVDAQGWRRLDDSGDYVRLELETALAHEVTVIPVLMEGARMPAPTDLPESLKELSFQNALPLTDDRWDYDMQRLAEVMKGLAGTPLRSALVKAVKALLISLTLIVPNGLIIGFWTYQVASSYLAWGSPESIATDPVVYGQLAAIQALCVAAYSCVWMVLYQRLRRRPGETKAAAPRGPTAGAPGAEPQDTPRTE